MLFGALEDIDLSENAGKTEFILTFKIGRNTPLQNKHVNSVFAVPDK